MPCRGWDDQNGAGGYSQEEFDRISKLLCEATKKLAKGNIAMSKQLEYWYKAHLREDEIRKKAEKERLSKKKQRAKILSKLTTDELKVLGLIRSRGRDD